MRAQGFYTEMKETVESLHKNVDTFVNNRRSEGGQLLSGIEETKRHGSSSGLVDWERERLKELMDRMSMDPSNSPGSSPSKTSRPNYSSIGSQPQYTSPLPSTAQQFPSYNRPSNVPPSAANGTRPGEFTYQPASFGPVSPQINTNPQQTQQYQPQQAFSPQQTQQFSQPFSPSQQQSYQPQQQHSQSQSGAPNTAMPPGWVPPPPPGPPPNQDFNFGLTGQSYPAGPGGYAQAGQRGQQQGQQQQQDPWSGLAGWR